MSHSNIAEELGKKSREELVLFAKRLRIINCRHFRKHELVTAILNEGEQQVARILHPTWWQRYHNHVYGAASVIGLILTVLFFVWPSINSQAANGGVETPIRFADFARMTPKERATFIDEYRGSEVLWEGYFKAPSGFEPGGLRLQVEEPVAMTIGPSKGDYLQITADCKFGILGAVACSPKADPDVMRV